jgi:aminoglycoside phosphotransferase (APT) family kinase protein
MLSPDELSRLESYLSQAIADGAPVRIEAANRIAGGASRQTYSLDATIDGARRGLILRRDPPDSLIDTERALEYAAYQSAQNQDVPAPRPLALAEDEGVLGAPFFVMERIENAAAGSPFNPNSFGEHAAAIGREFFAILGRVAAIDPHASPLARVVAAPDPDACWKRELDHWAGVIAADSLEPHPIAQATIRRLRRNPPPAPRTLAIVHGDYRIGNFLHDGQGAIKAVLDWEMAHIGDPLEDLAWALDPLWALGRKDLAAGLIPMDEAIALWERNSGHQFDAERFRWWSLFASLKGLAIWISSARAYHAGVNNDPVLGFSGWYCLTRHNKILADRLAAAARGSLG